MLYWERLTSHLYEVCWKLERIPQWTIHDMIQTSKVTTNYHNCDVPQCRTRCNSTSFAPTDSNLHEIYNLRIVENIGKLIFPKAISPNVKIATKLIISILSRVISRILYREPFSVAAIIRNAVKTEAGSTNWIGNNVGVSAKLNKGWYVWDPTRMKGVIIRV